MLVPVVEFNWLNWKLLSVFVLQLHSSFITGLWLAPNNLWCHKYQYLPWIQIWGVHRETCAQRNVRTEKRVHRETCARVMLQLSTEGWTKHKDVYLPVFLLFSYLVYIWIWMYECDAHSFIDSAHFIFPRPERCDITNEIMTVKSGRARYITVYMSQFERICSDALILQNTLIHSLLLSQTQNIMWNQTVQISDGSSPVCIIWLFRLFTVYLVLRFMVHCG